ncbi:MAG: hypothetical protein ACK5P5_12215 [Pseudobdellovibrionaceae bacterium]
MLTKFFTIAFFLICSVQSLNANTNPAPRSGGTPGTGTSGDFQAYQALSLGAASIQRCDNFSNRYSENYRKYQSYCEQAGGNATDCESLMNECREEIADLADRSERTNALQTIQSTSTAALQSENSFQQILGAGGSALSSNLSRVQGRCPRTGPRDYNTAYRELKNDVKDVNKRVAEERKEILKKQTELEKDQQDITKDSTKAKEKYEKAKLDMERKRQDQSEEHFKNTQKAQKTLGEIETRAMRLNLEYSRVLTDESATTQQYMAYAERNITAGCRAQVQKQRTELLGNTNQKRGSSMNLIRQGTENNKMLQNLFNSCYAAQDQKLQSDLQEKKNKKLEVQDAIKKIEEERQRIEEAIANAEDSLQQLNTINDREVAKEEQSYLDEINNLQQRLQMTASKFEREQRNSTQELNRLNTELQSSQVEIAGLGPRPTGENNSVGFGEANTAREVAMDNLEQFKANCCRGESAQNRLCNIPGRSDGGSNTTTSGTGNARGRESN